MKYEKRKESPVNKKTRTILLTVVASVLLLTAAIGGTMAWLVDNTAPLTNTFTPTTIGVTLTETTGETYQMVPGATITKDPKVTIKPGSVPCYVFVKVEEQGSYIYNNENGTAFESILQYEFAEGWNIAYKRSEIDEGADDIYLIYRTVSAKEAASGVSYSILKDNQIKVLTSVTKERLAAAGNPKLIFTASVIQSEHLVDANGNPLTLSEDTAGTIWSMANGKN